MCLTPRLLRYLYTYVLYSVADPDQLNPEPDPAIQVNRDSDPRLWWPKMLKKIQLELLYEIFFWLKIAIYLSLGLHKGRPSYKRGFQSSEEHIQHFKKWNLLSFFCFCGSYLPSWIRFRIRNTGNVHYPYFALPDFATEAVKPSALTCTHQYWKTVLLLTV